MPTRKKNMNGEDVDTTSSTSSVVEDAKASASQAWAQTQEKVGQATSQAQEKAKSQLGEQKDRVASGVESVAQALRRTSDQLQEEQPGAVSDYVSKAADKLADISTYIRQNNINDLLREAESFARREPAIFLGSAFALGVIAARFLKSSGPSQSYNADRRLAVSDYGSGNQYARAPYAAEGSEAAYSSFDYGNRDSYGNTSQMNASSTSQSDMTTSRYRSESNDIQDVHEES